MVASDSCGPIATGQGIIRHVTGTYTPTTNGIHTLEILNERPNDPFQPLLQNYIDDISLVPQTTDFTSDTIQFSAATSNQANFTLNPGPAYAGWNYIVLLSASGNYPGVVSGGNWLLLNMDNVFTYSKMNYNSAMLVNTLGKINASGQASATLKTFNPMLGWQGRTLNVAYILFQSAPPVPLAYASMPVSILFIP